MPIESLFLIAILIFSVILHEMAHGLMAERLGDPTARLSGRLTLNPIPHLDLWGSFIIPLVLILTNAGFIIGWAKPVPYNPHNLRNKKWGEALVAGAGPATNIGIALLFSILLRVNAGSGFLPSSFVALTMSVVFINLLLAFFNLVPIPPLDGSKVLASLVPFHLTRRFSLQAFTARYGFMGGFLLILLFLFFLWPVFFKFVAFLFTLFVGMPLVL
ncbi:MAG: site-2 protease family protein [Parcubacteria group bacterium]|nr:site-2 protease family protein [Parcubacteria group bacterium]MBI2049095.1 site-2 protease family protein [Parcubacteria group bacterium]